MKWIPLILLLPASAAPAQSPFCNQVKSVTDQAADGFRNLRGTLDETGSYRSVYAFPGANACRISESRYTYEFRCSWRYEENEWESALADARALAGAVAECCATNLSDLGEERDAEDDAISWHGRLGLPRSRLTIEIAANNFAARIRSVASRRLTNSSLTVRYRRQAQRE